LTDTVKIVLVVEYDGTEYCGFQWQAGQVTVQGAIEAALHKLTGEKRRVIAASRTDTGVHAGGQVLGFRSGAGLDLRAFVHGMNHYLDNDIAVRKAYRMPESFNARRDAASREYRYTMLNRAVRSPLMGRFAHEVAGELDAELMEEASQLLAGRHDMASFVPKNEAQEKDTVREVFYTGVQREGDTVTFRVAANSYLRHQVRNTAGALIRVGQKRATVEEFREILEAKTPGLAGPRAPACGLCLERVNYPFSLREVSEEHFDEDV